LYRVGGLAGKTHSGEVRGEMRVFRHKFDHLVFGTGIADVFGVFDENPSRSLPGMAGGKLDAGLR
jgi:hypothetical protein